ncbi:MAG: amino acid adenylation domain-containing protein, partial [Caldilineaceae bacterium]|nr:amino acid adenylation domain-containing protein [Caldilineaceae bacterium]
MISLERNCPTTPMATEIRNSSRQPTCTAEESCPAPELSGSIVEHFARIVAAAAPHPALWHDGVSISYGAMNSRANQIANVILAHTTAATPLVALLFTQGIDPLVAMMGVLKAGKAYVTLDANAVPHQLLAILEDAQATIVLTNQQTLAAAQVIADAGYHVINLDALQSASGEDPHVPTDAETRMAVYYTSGSTGKPKGLERNHRFTVRVALRNVETYQYIPGDRVAVTLHWQWGMAAEAYYGGLLGGATIYLCALNKQSVTDFIQWLAVHQINVVYLPIGFYRTMIDSLQGNEKWQALRFVVLGGDPLYAADIDAFKVHFPPHVTIDYRLGLTEASTLTSIQIDHTTELEGPTVPVGYPCRFQEITIHDEADQPLGVNQIGEIVVKSHTMSTGYWRNPTLTAEKFLPDPEGSDKRIYHTGDLGRIRPDGMLELLGRKDQMVKIRGYRVELTAIEAELMTHPLIDNAVVVAHEDAAGNKQLVAYLIAQLSGAEVATLRNTLQKRLPDYMIPSHFMMLDTIPVTANGKIDRKALPAPPKSRPDLPTLYIAPRTPIEAQLATIWETILDRRPIGIHDDFFAL